MKNNNKQTLKNIVTIVAIIMGTSSVTFSQTIDPCGCNAVLIKDQINATTDEFEQYYYYNKLEWSDVQKLQTEIRGSGSYYEIIQASSDNENYKERLQKHLQLLESKYSRNYSTTYYEYRTNNIAYEHWSRCKASCDKTGVSIFLNDEDKDKISYTIKYVAGNGATPPYKYTLEIFHADNTIEKVNGEILSGTPQTFFVKRKCSSENDFTKTMFIVNCNGTDSYTSKFFCGDPPPEKPTSFIRRLKIDTQIQTAANQTQNPSQSSLVNLAFGSSNWTFPPTPFEGRQVRVDVDNDGQFTIYAKSIHHANGQWQNFGRSDYFPVINNGNVGGVYINVSPQEEDEWFIWWKRTNAYFKNKNDKLKALLDAKNK